MVNAVKERILAPKDIIILVEDIRWLCSYFTSFVFYCCREDNKDADVIAKKAHM